MCTRLRRCALSQQILTLTQTATLSNTVTGSTWQRANTQHATLHTKGNQTNRTWMDWRNTEYSCRPKQGTYNIRSHLHRYVPLPQPWLQSPPLCEGTKVGLQACVTSSVASSAHMSRICCMCLGLQRAGILPWALRRSGHDSCCTMVLYAPAPAKRAE